jgi:solute carrier family 35 protein F1/2
LSALTTDGPDNEVGLLATIEILRQSTRSKRLGHWKILLFGQFIALVAASGNAFSFTLIYTLGIEIPLLVMNLTYFVLALSFLQRVRHDSLKDEGADQQERRYKLPFSSITIHVPWWVYVLIAFLDVEANFLILMSFRYTSLTSTTLLGSLMIPSVMVISWLLLSRQFRVPHFLGVALCIVGGTMTVFIDGDQSHSRQQHSYLGDFLAIAAALLFGLGDTVAEYSIKHIDRCEYLLMLGLFGFILTAIQFPLLEGSALVSLLTSAPVSTQIQAGIVVVLCVTALSFFYVSATLFLVHGDATLLVLSLQATQFWAIVFSFAAEGHAPSPWFFVAALLVVTGVFIYELWGGQQELPPSMTPDNVDEEKSLLRSTLAKPATYCTVT